MTAPVLQLDQVVAGHTVEPEALREVATAIGTRVSELPMVELTGLSAAETQLFDLQRTLHTSASSYLTVHLGDEQAVLFESGPSTTSRFCPAPGTMAGTGCSASAPWPR